MTKTFPDIPNWQFTIEEISVDVYRVDGVNEKGNRVSEVSSDLENALQICKEYAAKIELTTQKG